MLLVGTTTPLNCLLVLGDSITTFERILDNGTGNNNRQEGGEDAVMEKLVHRLRKTSNSNKCDMNGNIRGCKSKQLESDGESYYLDSDAVGEASCRYALASIFTNQATVN